MTLTLTPKSGETLMDVCLDAGRVSRLLNVSVEFTFNDTTIIVEPVDTVYDTMMRWEETRESLRQKDKNS